MSGLDVELAGPEDPCEEPILTRDQYVAQSITGIDPDAAFAMYLGLRNWTCGDVPQPWETFAERGIDQQQLMEFVFGGGGDPKPVGHVPLPGSGSLLACAILAAVVLPRLRALKA